MSKELPEATEGVGTKRVYNADLDGEQGSSAGAEKATADVITVLETQGPLATKKFFRKEDGTVGKTSYGNAKKFNVELHEVAGIYELYELLKELEDDPHRLLIRGLPKEGKELSEPVLRRKVGHPEGNGIFEPHSGHRWLPIDIDEFSTSSEVVEIDEEGHLRDPESLVRCVVEEVLPPYFHNVTFCYQFSSSAGIPSWETVRLRLHFWTDEPHKDEILHDVWQKHYVPQVDQAMYRDVQAIYTASPIFEEGVEDPCGEWRSGLLRGVGDTVTIDPSHLVEPEEVRKKKEQKDRVVAEGTSVPSDSSRAWKYLTKTLENVVKDISGMTDGRHREILRQAYRLAGHAAYHLDKRQDEYVELLRTSLTEAAEASGAVAKHGRADIERSIENGIAGGGKEQLPVEALMGSSEILSKIPRLTEGGFAQEFAERYREELMYVPGRGFLEWNGKFWGGSEHGESNDHVAKTRCMDMLVGYQKAASARISHDPKDKTAKALLRLAARLESSSGINSVIRLASALPEIRVGAEKLDANLFLHNNLSGTMNLKTGKLQPHRPEDRITKISHIVYDPNAKCPRWEKFQREVTVGDESLVLWKQKRYGMTLSGTTQDHKFYVHYGAGRNGKTTEQRVVELIYGDYHRGADYASFTARYGNQQTNDLARLAGARSVVAEEGEPNQRLNESLVKTLTGGGTIVARYLYSHHFEFSFQGKITLVTNHKPAILGGDHAIWSRIVLVPFPATFSGDQIDMGLTEKLMKEASGIYNWMIEGFRLYEEEGLGTCAAIEEANQEYRRDSDSLSDFLEDACLVEKGNEQIREETKTLYDIYLRHCESNYEDRPVKFKTFGKMLTERGFPAVKGGKGKNYRAGIRLKEVADNLETSNSSGWGANFRNSKN